MNKILRDLGSDLGWKQSIYPTGIIIIMDGGGKRMLAILWLSVGADGWVAD